MKKKCLVTVLCLFLTANLACSIPTRVKDYPNGFVDKETIETDDSVNFNVYDDKGEIVSVVNAKVIKDSNATYPICSIEQIKFDEQRMKTIADAIFEPGSVKVISFADGREIGGPEAIRWYYYEIRGGGNVVKLGYCRIRGVIDGSEYELDFGQSMSNETVELYMTDENHEPYACDVYTRNCTEFSQNNKDLSSNEDIQIEVSTVNKLMNKIGIDRSKYEMVAYFDTLILGNGAKAQDPPNATYMYYSGIYGDSIRPYCSLMDQYGYFGIRKIAFTDRETLTDLKIGNTVKEVDVATDSSFYSENNIPQGMAEEAWPYETLSFAVEKNGKLREFSWISPISVRVESSDVTLLEFDKVTELAQRYITSYNIFVAKYIDSMELGMAPAKTEAGGYYMVPAWYFFGNKNNEESYPKNPESYLIVNAIDGTMISSVVVEVITDDTDFE